MLAGQGEPSQNSAPAAVEAAGASAAEMKRNRVRTYGQAATPTSPLELAPFASPTLAPQMTKVPFAAEV